MSHASPAYQMTEMQGARAIGAWQQWMSTLYGLESDAYGDAYFSARLGTFALGNVGMTKIEAGRHRVRQAHPVEYSVQQVSRVRISSCVTWAGTAGMSTGVGA